MDFDKESVATVDENSSDVGLEVSDAVGDWKPSASMRSLIDEPIGEIEFEDTQWLKGDKLFAKNGEPEDHYFTVPRYHNEYISIQPNFAKKIIDHATAKEGPYFNLELLNKIGGSQYKRASAIIGRLLKMIGSSNDVYEVSEHQKLWDRKLSEHGFIPDVWENGQLAQVMCTTNEMVIHKLNEVFGEVVKEAKSYNFRKRLSRREQTAERRLKSIQYWLANAFDRFSRLLVLRIDLHFHDRLGNDLTPKKSKEWFQKFTLGLQERTKLAKGYVGYAGVLEYGANQNYHIHAIFLYDAAVRDNITYTTAQLADYWKELTDGGGYAFDCSRSKNAHRYRGIGVIHYTNEEALKELFHVVAPYICKRDKFFRVQPSGARGFWRSGLTEKTPRYERKRVGRQREAGSAQTLLDFSKRPD